MIIIINYSIPTGLILDTMTHATFLVCGDTKQQVGRIMSYEKKAKVTAACNSICKWEDN